MANSSIPPSSEHPHSQPVRKLTQGKRRKKGGQKGHKRHIRELIPSAQCKKCHRFRPLNCQRCGGDLGSVYIPSKRHQFWEIPEIKPLVYEYQLHRGHCHCCGHNGCIATCQCTGSAAQVCCFQGFPDDALSPKQALCVGILYRSARLPVQLGLDRQDSELGRSNARKAIRITSRRLGSAKAALRGRITDQGKP